MMSKINMHKPRGPPQQCKMDYMPASKWEVAPSAPDRANTPRPMHDTRLCQQDVKMTNDSHGTNKM